MENIKKYKSTDLQFNENIKLEEKDTLEAFIDKIVLVKKDSGEVVARALSEGSIGNLVISVQMFYKYLDISACSRKILKIIIPAYLIKKNGLEECLKLGMGKFKIFLNSLDLGLKTSDDYADYYDGGPIFKDYRWAL